MTEQQSPFEWFWRAVSALRHRWPETLLIVAVGAGISVVIESAVMPPEGDPAVAGHRPGWAMFALGFGVAAIGILWQMGCLGFLRSLLAEPLAAREPAALIAEGRRFFWRFLGGQLVGGALWWLFSAMGFWLVGAALGYQTFSQTPLWLVHLISAAAMGLASKWLLGLPAVIVVFDLPLRQALAETFLHRLAAFSISLRQLVGALVLIAALSAVGSAYSIDRPVGLVCRFVAALGHQMIILTLIAQATTYLGSFHPPTAAQERRPDQEGE